MTEKTTLIIFIIHIAVGIILTICDMTNGILKRASKNAGDIEKTTPDKIIFMNLTAWEFIALMAVGFAVCETADAFIKKYSR